MPNSDLAHSRFLGMLQFELEELAGFLDDPEIVEIMVNPDGQVWLDSHASGTRLGDLVLEPRRTESLLGSIASFFGKELTGQHPTLEALLPHFGYRIAGAVPPVSSGPMLTIRKPPNTIYTLDDLQDQGLLSALHRSYLETALRERKNILVSGGTGSGKTTFANALLREISAFAGTDRFVVLEEVPELQLHAPNTVFLRTTPTLPLAALVRLTLWLRPDRIIVGEVRGAEALDLLKSWNTGHPGGVTTIHANSAASTLSRLDQLAMEGGAASQRRLIAETIDLIVHIAGRGTTRLVQELSVVRGLLADGSSFDLLPLSKERPSCTS
jgi:type IV secretion system protein TrbB